MSLHPNVLLEPGIFGVRLRYGLLLLFVPVTYLSALQSPPKLILLVVLRAASSCAQIAQNERPLRINYDPAISVFCFLSK